MEINLHDLNLPEDVIDNSWDYIPLYGELTGDPTEIVVITQLKREVFGGRVCHTEWVKANRNETCLVINDMPGFVTIWCKYPSTIKTFNGVRYTMACLAERYNFPRTNWL